MSEIKLLPCPFCGRKAELRYNKDGFAYILCANDGCYARTDGCLNENEASRLWNTRKPMERIIERLEESADQCIKIGDVYGFSATNEAIFVVKEEGGIE